MFWVLTRLHWIDLNATSHSCIDQFIRNLFNCRCTLTLTWSESSGVANSSYIKGVTVIETWYERAFTLLFNSLVIIETLLEGPDYSPRRFGSKVISEVNAGRCGLGAVISEVNAATFLSELSQNLFSPISRTHRPNLSEIRWKITEFQRINDFGRERSLKVNAANFWANRSEGVFVYMPRIDVPNVYCSLSQSLPYIQIL